MTMEKKIQKTNLTKGNTSYEKKKTGQIRKMSNLIYVYNPKTKLFTTSSQYIAKDNNKKK